MERNFAPPSEMHAPCLSGTAAPGAMTSPSQAASAAPLRPTHRTDGAPFSSTATRRWARQTVGSSTTTSLRRDRPSTAGNGTYAPVSSTTSVCGLVFRAARVGVTGVTTGTLADRFAAGVPQDRGETTAGAQDRGDTTAAASVSFVNVSRSVDNVSRSSTNSGERFMRTTRGPDMVSRQCRGTTKGTRDRPDAKATRDKNQPMIARCSPHLEFKVDVNKLSITSSQVTLTG